MYAISPKAIEFFKKHFSHLFLSRNRPPKLPICYAIS